MHFTSNGTDQCQNGSSNLLIAYREQPRSTRILSNKAGKSRSNQFLINKSKFLKATRRAVIRKIEIPRTSMVVEALGR